MARAITPKSLLSDLRKYSGGEAPIWMVRREKEWWITTSYFTFTPKPTSAGAFEDLLDACNLYLEEQRLVADLCLTSRNGATPKIDATISLEGTEPITCLPRGEEHGLLLREDADGTLYELWRRLDGSWITVSADFAALVRKHVVETVTWVQAGPESPIVGVEEHGRPVASLVPLQTRLIRDPDMPPQLFSMEKEAVLATSD